MKLAPFELERLMSTFQNQVEADLSASGAQAATLGDIVDDDELRRLSTIPLRYVQTNGPLELRTAIARRHAGSTPDDVLVTNGSSEALMLLTWHLCEPGVDVVQIGPTYSAVGGVARTLGANVRTAQLSEADGWALDRQSLADAITDRTVIVYVGNPNNPTGSILSNEDMAAIVEAASRVGAWLVADEIYHGAELDGVPTTSFWGMYERVVVTSSLSKAHGLGGLRVGWMVAPRELTARVWSYRDYTTTTTTALGAAIATAALEPDRERLLLDRALTISRTNVAVLDGWCSDHRHVVSGWRTRVGGFAFLKVVSAMGSEALVTRLLHEHGVLLGPGSHFGAEHHLRLGYSVAHLADGLERLGAGLDALAPHLEPTHDGGVHHVR